MTGKNRLSTDIEQAAAGHARSQIAQAKSSDAAKHDPHPGMMGDGTEEQNLGQPGDPSARITEGEVKQAFTGKLDSTHPKP